MNMIGGLEQPTSGKVVVDESVIDFQDIHDSVLYEERDSSDNDGLDNYTFSYASKN